MAKNFQPKEVLVHHVLISSGIKVASLMVVNAFGSVLILKGNIIFGPKSKNSFLDTNEILSKNPPKKEKHFSQILP